MKFLLIIAALIIHYNTSPQNKEWLVKPGEDVKNALGDSVIYQYPQFKD